MSENNGGSMMGGFLLGALVGAGVALLVAPMAGEETRRRIGDSARRLKTGATGRIDGVRDAIEHGASDVSSAIDAGKDAFRRSAEKSASMRDHV